MLIELVMAAALLVIIVAEQLSKLVRWWRRTCVCAAQAQHDDVDCYVCQAVHSEEGQQQQQGKEQWNGAYTSLAGATSQDIEAADGSSSSSGGGSSSSSSSDSSSDVGDASGSSEALHRAGGAGDCTLCVVDAEVTSDVSKTTLSDVGCCMRPSSHALLMAAPTAAIYQPDDGNLLLPLLLGADSSGDASAEETELPSSSTADRGSAIIARGPRGGVRAWLAVLGIGAVAGTASGIMEGLTGGLAEGCQVQRLQIHLILL
jgi:hypothetical protein